MIPKDYIVNPPFAVGANHQSDFVLKALHIVNDTDSTFELTSITYELMASDEIVREIICPEYALTERLLDGHKKITTFDTWGLKSWLGSSIQWNREKMSEGRILASGAECVIINEFFNVVATLPIDLLGIKVTYKQDGQEKTERIVIQVLNYHTKNDYIFPVKGVWQINGNYDCYNGHRTQYSMEFGIDFGQLHSNGLFAWKEVMKDEDFLSYGKEVNAIGDGIVIDCFNDAYWHINFPHDTASDEEKAERAKIQEVVGRLPIQCGNYAIIQHEHGEYSFYGHMIQKSVTVQKGQQVKQGEVIGRIGNVGFSGAPHLHFHLMDGNDFYSARGLPCHFANLVDCWRNPISLIQEEYTIVFAK
jgi:hypothetical protein